MASARCAYAPRAGEAEMTKWTAWKCDLCGQTSWEEGSAMITSIVVNQERVPTLEYDLCLRCYAPVKAVIAGDAKVVYKEKKVSG
jgi:hypothetical protein